jgi:hypothetical protein
LPDFLDHIRNYFKQRLKYLDLHLGDLQATFDLPTEGYPDHLSPFRRPASWLSRGPSELEAAMRAPLMISLGILS